MQFNQNVTLTTLLDCLILLELHKRRSYFLSVKANLVQIFFLWVVWIPHHGRSSYWTKWWRGRTSGRKTKINSRCCNEALLRNHLLLSTGVAMLTIYSSISLMFPTSSYAVPLKHMVSSKKIPVCTSRDNYVWHQISGKTIARSSHSNKLRCKTIALLVSSTVIDH